MLSLRPCDEFMLLFTSMHWVSQFSSAQAHTIILADSSAASQLVTACNCVS